VGEVHRLRVAEVIRETADAVSVVLAVPPELAHRYAYRPGQFLTLRIPGLDGASLARCYSLSSSPHEGDDLRVTVKRVANGRGSGWLVDQLCADTELDVLPPAGTFTPRSLDEDLLLVAAGSGITPVMSILRATLATGRGQLVLLYANRDEQSVIFGDELRELSAANPDRLLVLHWLESVQGLPDSSRLAALLRPLTGSREVFLCGPGPFMDAVTHALRDAGVPRSRLHIERFISLTTDPFDMPSPVPDAETGTDAQLEVELDGERHSLAWPAGVRLLDLLRDRGLDAPFSCREGACSACACRLTSGEVKMLRNEVLDQTDLDDGYILACQSVPVTESVAVTYD
jgi:3-ketosteroid 9alpha-monooxygenase subunit B